METQSYGSVIEQIAKPPNVFFGGLFLGGAFATYTNVYTVRSKNVRKHRMMSYFKIAKGEY
jgi:hypothetical protein